jgi:hypothetical protein
MSQNQHTSVPSLPRAIATGAIGFGVVSLCVFATVAFAEEWLYRIVGELGAYLIWILLFVVLSGVVFESIVVVRTRLPNFYLLWAIAFFAYAAAWMGAYFVLGRSVGEIIGSLVGSVLMALVFAAGFGSLQSTAKLSALIFVANAFGYFIGAALFDANPTQTGMLLFGAVYGVFFGAGIGAALHIAQRQSAEVSSTAH